jgi:tRNA (guanine-N7-)-methyltransferase
MRAAFHSQPANALAELAQRVEFVPANYFARTKPADIFEREAPLELDIGCGEGAFIEAIARQHPERNYLGIERLLARVRKVCRNIARHGLSNARVLRMESFYAVKNVLPLESVAVAHVSFPDPWPKRYHHRRRLVQATFLRELHAVLAPGGELRVKTDDQPYFLWMENAFAAVSGYERLDWPDDPEYPLTDFEQRFIAQGMPIYRARLRKV